MSIDRTFPGGEWQRRAPADLGFDAAKLEAVDSWLREIGAEDEPFHFAICRSGYLIAEWNKGVDPHQHQSQASAAKSYYSCILGLAIAEGKLLSADAKVVDYYPQMMDVPPGAGPKEGRHVFEKDRDITFRQLICNCSGYMKPGEDPGKIFHYQTYGMNILTHALATLYGLYDINDPERLPGCAQLIADKIAAPIGGSWSHRYSNFDLHAKARLPIFGYYTQVCSTAYDTLRAGWLWLNYGKWNGVQVVPEAYLRAATQTNPFIKANEPQEQWGYGHGFWVNDYGVEWPDLPRDSFAARGAGAKLTWMCPSLDLVITQNPGPWEHFSRDEETRKERIREILGRIIETLKA
jgi:CubicO group peptidase (beta-lactamase class C family)